MLKRKCVERVAELSQRDDGELWSGNVGKEKCCWEKRPTRGLVELEIESCIQRRFWERRQLIR